MKVWVGGWVGTHTHWPQGRWRYGCKQVGTVCTNKDAVHGEHYHNSLPLRKLLAYTIGGDNYVASFSYREFLIHSTGL